MDSTTAFVAALVAAAAGGAVGSLAVRRSTPHRQPAADPAAWQRTHQRRAEAYAEFAEPAEQISHILETWPALSPASRQPQRKAAYEHLQTLGHRHDVVILDAGPDVRAAAQQLRDECDRLVRRLDLYAPPGPVDDSVRDLAMPFLRACREYLEAESDRHFGLRRPAGRSLFARLSTR
ncbi:hypothetical protein SEA_GILGAMESH_148 [Streptomyces phage Gilgamesh]|uniref:Uncharacterized protein n=1 Tax=Streptomyces phage Gilgamesh TaxID=2599890 RepID=A0A5J6TRA6_9CAUD|nr:hypothetical protein QEH35_gp148 [Streptomyces phage Gilgamesh]QFG13340.1 hypothetical protein SEA_GILGAMESH_148 [Streptomyces phage Gilgamesh]